MGGAGFLRRVEAEKVNSEVGNKEWRRLLLREMCAALNVSTDGREENSFRLPSMRVVIYNQTRKMTEQDSPPPTITAMKIPIIKKGEYDIWSMRMRQYICHTDHNLWDIIVDGDLQEEAAPAGEQSGPPAPKTAKQLTAKRNQERVKSILLLAIPDEYLLKFHNVPDAKSLSESIVATTRTPYNEVW
ncbi:hypothetical protein Tco_0551502 [Tanacetum coccineum]